MKTPYRLIMALFLAAALVSACAARPAVTPTSLPPTAVQPTAAAATSTSTATPAAVASSTSTATPTDPPVTVVPATATALPTATTLPTATIPVPPAAAAYLTGAQVLTYDPLSHDSGLFDFNGGSIYFEEGRMVTKSNRWDTYNWASVFLDPYKSGNGYFIAGTAILIQFNFHGYGNYFGAGFSRNGIKRGLDYTTQEGFYMVDADGKSPIGEGNILNNYLARAGEWNSLLLAAGEDGSFRVMVIDPQHPQRIYCWETQKPEWEGKGWEFQGIGNNSGTLELKEFMIIQFDGFEKCFQ